MSVQAPSDIPYTAQVSIQDPNLNSVIPQQEDMACEEQKVEEDPILNSHSTNHGYQN